MTIKEVEARTGLTRANIRYYEGEGFSAWASPSAAPYGPGRVIVFSFGIYDLVEQKSRYFLLKCLYAVQW